MFIIIMVTYMIRIHKAKEMYFGSGVADGSSSMHPMPKVRGSFWGVLISAVILLLLPILVPMKTYFIAIVCCCAIMAELIAFRDRIDQLKNGGGDSTK